MKKDKYPEVLFGDIDPFNEYYEDGEGSRYSVARLVKETENSPVFDMPLAGLDLSYRIWAGCNMHSLAYHVKKVQVCSLDYPIILDWNGSIADGRHRVMKALCEGKSTIKAVRLRHKMEPDSTGN